MNVLAVLRRKIKREDLPKIRKMVNCQENGGTEEVDLRRGLRRLNVKYKFYQYGSVYNNNLQKKTLPSLGPGVVEKHLQKYGPVILTHYVGTEYEKDSRNAMGHYVLIIATKNRKFLLINPHGPHNYIWIKWQTLKKFIRRSEWYPSIGYVYCKNWSTREYTLI
jgi:hypothetical protein